MRRHTQQLQHFFVYDVDNRNYRAMASSNCVGIAMIVPAASYNRNKKHVHDRFEHEFMHVRS